MTNYEDYEDIDIDDPENPELTDEDVARMRPFREVFPDLYEQMVRDREDPAPPDRKAS